MDTKDYKKALDKVKSSKEFQMETIKKMESKYDKSQEKKGLVFNMTSKKLKYGLVAFCALLAVGLFSMYQHSNGVSPTPNNEANISQPDKTSPGPSLGKVKVNIEGIITEVSEDGKSFKLDSGLWVETNDDTEMGITGPTAAPKSEQLFEDSFRVGNSIAGFTLDDTPEDKVIAYAIYSNWNWEDPIR